MPTDLRLVRPVDLPRPHTAFVLGGGASLGAMQAGMLLALYEHGIAADVLIGTSAGALNAGFVASRPQTPATAEALAALWRGLRRDDVFPIRPWMIAEGLLTGRDHLVPADRLRKLLASHLEFEDLAAAPLPVHVVAFDVEEGCEVLLSAGPAFDAFAASAAIPGILPPVPFAGRRLIDGGVSNNTPISHAVALGARRIYVLATHGPAERRTPRYGALGARYEAALLGACQLEADLDRFAGEAEIVLLPAPNELEVQPVDFSHPGRLIADAAAAARLWLAEELEPLQQAA
jgi:NTE family protein